jgi:hypothetical protein
MGLEGDVVGPLFQLRRVGQVTVNEQVRGFKVRTSLGKLLDRVAAIFKNPEVAIDVRDTARAGCGVGEGGVVRHEPEVVVAAADLTEVHRADGAFVDGNLVRLPGAVVCDGE